MKKIGIVIGAAVASVLLPALVALIQVKTCPRMVYFYDAESNRWVQRVFDPKKGEHWKAGRVVCIEE